MLLTASCCWPDPPQLPHPLTLLQTCAPPPLEDVLPYDLNDDQLDLVSGAGTPAQVVGAVPLWKRLFWEGGRPVDAFFTVVSAQVCGCVVCGAGWGWVGWL
jgi:hypothetical protein